MGACLSCLRPSDDDEEYNERTSLLHNDFYNDEHLQEELLKRQQRQQELNNLVSELSDNLIDVSSFLLSAPNITNSAPGTPNLSMVEKQYPNYLSKVDKEKILEDMKSLDSSIKDKCKVENNESLYLKF